MKMEVAGCYKTSTPICHSTQCHVLGLNCTENQKLNSYVYELLSSSLLVTFAKEGNVGPSNSYKSHSLEHIKHCD
jgi:hypothetical protein